MIAMKALERFGMGMCSNGTKCGVVAFAKRNILRWYSYIERMKMGYLRET